MKRYVYIVIVAVFMLIFVVFSDKYILSVKTGLELYAICVLPALFPFFFFSKILTELNLGYDLGVALKKPLKAMYNAPSLSGYIMIISMLCGYPLGAKLIADCYSNNLIDGNDAKAISSFTSTSGPLFVVGTVGIAMLGSKKAGFVILISHYMATLLNGLIYKRKCLSKDKMPQAPIIHYDKILSESMLSAIKSILIVGGYVAIFNMILDVFLDIKLIYLLSNIFANLGVDSRLSTAFFAALIEITKGSLLFANCGFSPKTVLPLMAFCISFGGVSVTMQSLTFLSKCKISPAYYLLTKFTQGILAFLVCLAFCHIII